MSGVPHAVSLDDLDPETRRELEAWLETLDRGHFAGEVAGGYEPTPEDREWWAGESERPAAPDGELVYLTAADWQGVEDAGLDAYADAKDRGLDHYEAVARADAARERAIGERVGRR